MIWISFTMSKYVQELHFVIHREFSKTEVCFEGSVELCSDYLKVEGELRFEHTQAEFGDMCDGIKAFI